MVNKAWKILPRPLLETILNNHVQHHRVPQPLILHGPRGVGKTTLILERLLGEWNKGAHLTGYVDFAETIKDHHPQYNQSFPWTSWSNCPPPTLSDCRNKLEDCLESMAEKGVMLGTITAQQIFSTLNKWHGLNTALRRILQSSNASKSAVSKRASLSSLWDRAIFMLSARYNGSEMDRILGLSEKGCKLSIEEASYFKEAIVALKLAKEVIKVQQGWRANAIAHLNRTSGFSRSLAHCCTDWPCLLLELLSQAAEIDHFQPKLVINNIEVLKHATLNNEFSVSGPQYHDSLIWRIISLGVNERCLPVVLVTSDSYYSYKAFLDFGFIDIFISRETFGWAPQEAKMHMVIDYFSQSEWTVIAELLGPNPRHLFELYVLKQSNYYQEVTGDKATFEDIVDVYLAYLQVKILNFQLMRNCTRVLKLDSYRREHSIRIEIIEFSHKWLHRCCLMKPSPMYHWNKIQRVGKTQRSENSEMEVKGATDDCLPCWTRRSTMELGLVIVLRKGISRAFLFKILLGRDVAFWLLNQRGRFLCITEFFQGGQKVAVMVPEGIRGIGWSQFGKSIISLLVPKPSRGGGGKRRQGEATIRPL
ncbi:Embryo defective 1381 isoform 1 [Senna tora]|uniref:Embryo defective 1381 isoform 1 n=1 Tax=Senna tora TaxID=362788 RepID=A0A834WVD7_9FABA|nr:Embryo defective 1381 isoform 1 [Senna tora]